jgi:hypothetical protein
MKQQIIPTTDKPACRLLAPDQPDTCSRRRTTSKGYARVCTGERHIYTVKSMQQAGPVARQQGAGGEHTRTLGAAQQRSGRPSVSHCAAATRGTLAAHCGCRQQKARLSHGARHRAAAQPHRDRQVALVPQPYGSTVKHSFVRLLLTSELLRMVSGSQYLKASTHVQQH